MNYHFSFLNVDIQEKTEIKFIIIQCIYVSFYYKKESMRNKGMDIKNLWAGISENKK